ncbi:MAG: amidohydrolase [Deltaproteobacteria bacterium]|nr:amidohydrolase [Deltaproteobacteria bacterium]
MRLEDMILVSVDDHVVEPPTLFDQHLADPYKARAPRVVHKTDGTDVWLFEGRQLPNIGLNAVVGRPPEEYGMEPTSYEQLRPGCWNVDERVRDMNANGVLGQMCFPSFPQFAGQLFATCEDKELALALLRAYNDWHIDEWCGSYPGRFIPLSLPAIWDPKLMADEVRRVARKGCHTVSFSQDPQGLGHPSIHDEHWNPVWQACADEGTIVTVHIGSGSGMFFTSPDAPVDVMITNTPMSIANFASDLLWSPILRRYPTLKFALAEGGIGWIPYLLERADYVYKHHHRWTHQDFGDKLPSDLFREHIVTCFIDDEFGIRNRHAVGIDGITWECDYPHSDTTWPRAPETLARCFEEVPDEEVRKITHENAMRHFRYDPFAHIPREQCTVAALRAQAGDVDLAHRSQHGGTPPTPDTGRPVTTADIQRQLASAFTAPIAD